MKRTIILCLAGVLLLGLTLFAACGGIGDDGEEDGRTSLTTSSKAPMSTPKTPPATEQKNPPPSETSTPATTQKVVQNPNPIDTVGTAEGDGEEDEPHYVSLSLSSTEICTGSLIEVSAQNPYSYKVASLHTPTELDRLSSAELSELGWSSLYTNKSGLYLLRSRLLYLKNEAFTAFNLMMTNYVAKTGNRDVQVRYGYQLVNSSADATSLSDERVTGLVVEINVYTEEGSFSIDHISKKQAYYDWFAANCHLYGFVMSGESGYFRYVGLPHALYMKQNKLSLSAYHALLADYSYENPLAVADANGVLWNIYFVPVSSGALTEVKIRENSVYVISGNNRNGFVVASRDKG